jgi:arginyl-tRNA synthetase
LAVGFEKHGSDELLEADPITHLYDVYVTTNREAEAEILAAIHKERAEKRARGEPVEADVKAKADLDAQRAEAVKKGQEFVEPPPEAAGKEPEPTKAEIAWGNERSPIHSQARSFFRKMEDGQPSSSMDENEFWKSILTCRGWGIGDESALAHWRKFRDLSIKKYIEVYSRLNISFDVYSGESQVSQESQDKALGALVESGIVTRDQGALLVDLTKYKLGKTLVEKRDGTKLYITRDIGAAAERYEKYKFDKMMCVPLFSLFPCMYAKVAVFP